MVFKKNIYILGDSTSMTVGCENLMYPFFLSEMKNWSKGVTIKNFSLAGNTSSDIASLFFSKLNKNISKNDAVIIYLGNCDAASSEIVKGKYTLLRSLNNRIKDSLNIPEKKTRLKNKLNYFSWNNSFDPNIEETIPSLDFKYNISKIIKVCKKKSVHVVLIKATANENFPPGLGKGNFIFYKYLGLNETISNKLTIDDSRFTEALKLHEKNRLKEAISLYKNILLESNNISSPEYSLMIVNNVAVAKSQQGFYEEAKVILNLLLQEKASRKEIIYYNLAQIAKIEKNIKLYSYYKKLSYENDTSLYRIRKVYKDKLEEVNNENNNISFIKMSNLVKQNEFIDHCHLLPKAQNRLAKAIYNKLSNYNFSGKEKASLKNVIYNPELFKGNFKEFDHYYKTFSYMKSQNIKKNIEQFFFTYKDEIDNKKLINVDCAHYDIEKAIHYYSRHPMFELLADLKINKPIISSDVGRFPEYFLIRVIIPYIVKFEKNKKLNKVFKSDILRKSNDLKKILPKNTYLNIANSPEELNQGVNKDRLNRIIKNSINTLKSHLSEGSKVYERRKTTIFWYFRETLRFGSHSRISMLYDRVTLELIAESLAAGLLLNESWKLKKSKKIISIVRFLEKVVSEHEKHCLKIHNNNYQAKYIKIYDKIINSLEKKLIENFF